MRDWDYTWEHWREMSDEERAVIRAEIHAEMIRVNKVFSAVVVDTALSMSEFASAMTRTFGNHPEGAHQRDGAVR